MTPEEFLNGGKQVGTSADSFLGGGSFTIIPKEQKKSGLTETVRDVPSDIRETISGVTEPVRKAITTAEETRGRVESGVQSPVSGTFQTIGSGLRAGAESIGNLILGATKLFTSPRTEERISGAVQSGAQKIAGTETVQDLMQQYESLTPEQKGYVDGILGTAEGLATTLGAGPLTKAIKGGATETVKATGRVASQVAPIAGAVAQKSVALPARGVSEIQGALTGTSGETIRQAFLAARRGGKELEEFTQALRSKTTPEELVNRLREGTEKINTEKSNRFSEMLSQIGDETVDTSSILGEVKNNLATLGVRVSKDGVLDFSGSKFRTVPNAANKLQKMYDEVANLGASRTLKEVDTSRQALGALLLEGEDASARTANLAITNAINNVRTAGKSVDGYGQALTQFGDDAQFLNEISRALSSGDQATIDTAYRKLATSLKTNNEQRRNLLVELDEATDGYILSSVAGQQLSEELPRGLFRQIAAGIAGASVFTGGLSTSLIPALIFASPRVTGEVLRSLGIATSKIDNLLNAFGKVRKELNINPNFLSEIAGVGALTTPTTISTDGRSSRPVETSLKESPFSQEEYEQILDLATSFGAGGLAKAAPKLGKVAADFLKKEPPYELLKDMERFIDYVRIKKVPGNEQSGRVFEANIRDAIERFGLNPEQPNAKLADLFDDILSETRKLPKILRDSLGRFAPKK